MILLIILCTHFCFSKFSDRQFTPQLQFTFSQSDCVNQAFNEDITGTLQLIRNSTTSSCPTRTNMFGTFSNAARGVAILDTVNTDVLKTGPLGSYTSLWNNGGSSAQSLTVEMWLTPKTAIVSNPRTYLLEIADNFPQQNVGNPVIGTGSGDTNFQIWFDPTTIRMDAAITASDGSLTGQSIIDGEHCSSFQAILTSLHNAESYQFYFAMVIDSSQAGGVPLAVLGRRNGVISNFTTCSYDAKGQIEPVASSSSGTITAFTFNSGSVLRVGNTRSAAKVPASLGFPGEINFVGMYNTALNYSVLNSLFLDGLPNSVPTVKNISFII